jgi:replicative DNA helicase
MIEILASVNLSNSNSMKYPFIPELKDLNPNPSIFKYIDTVLFIRRPEFYGLTSDDEKESTYQLAQIYVNNIVKGSTQMCKLKYNSRYRLFEDFNTSNSFMKWDIEDDPF